MEKTVQIDVGAMKRLKGARSRLTPQQFRVFKGQILSGDADGAMRGLDKTLQKIAAQAGGM